MDNDTRIALLDEAVRRLKAARRALADDDILDAYHATAEALTPLGNVHIDLGNEYRGTR